MLYAIFGTSRTLAVGPVAVVSLLTAAAIPKLGDQGIDYVTAALTPAFLSAAFLLLLGLFRLGFLANFLSHPVIAGFITASGILVATSQLKHILGVNASGDTLIEMLHGLWSAFGTINWITVLRLAPAERAEIVVDFTSRSAVRLVSRNVSSGGMMGGGGMMGSGSDDAPFEIMSFDVGDAATTEPATLPAIGSVRSGRSGPDP